jgi:sphinganine-1-phosphate aldolase
VIFLLFLLRWTRKALLKLKGRGVVGTAVDCYVSLRRTLYGLFLQAPGVRSQVQKQVAAAMAKLEAKLVPSGPDVTRYLNLPKEGWSEETVRQEMEKLAAMTHTRWEDGMVSGAVYHGGESLAKLQTEAFGTFTVANPIHPDVFPGVRKMEAEIVAMVLAMFNAPSNGVGVTTSGGTESILMAVFSARQKAYAERGVKEPEMYVWCRHALVRSLTAPLQDSPRNRTYSIPEGWNVLRYQDPPGRLPSSHVPSTYSQRCAAY